MKQFDKITKYPPELRGRLNSFIVTEFDDSMTVEMQLRVLIKWIMKNIDLTNEMVDYLNKFIIEFNDKLYETVDDILNKWLADGIFEELINEKIWESILQNFKDYFPSVKDFGAKGDGVTNDDEAFEKALTERDFINVTNGVYRLSHLPRYDGKTINGIGDVVIILDAHLVLNNNTPLLSIGSNSRYTNIKFISEPISREWNRGDLQNQSDVRLSNCTFKGFTHVSTMPNAWGLYLDKSENIYIDNCYFEDNTQSDIAIVEGCSNIFITNCYGKKLHINLEPNTPNPRGKNVNITNCIIWQLDLQENNYINDSFDMITVTNCNIGNLKYKGLNTTLNNCKVDKISTWTPTDPTIGDIYFAGVLNSNSSLRLSENLLADPYVNDLSISSGENKKDTTWGFYTATSFENSFTRSSDKDGKFFHMNYLSKTDSNFSVKNNKRIPVNSNSWYMVKLLYKPVLKATTGHYRSIMTSIQLLNGDIQVGKTKRISSHRFSSNPIKNIEQVALVNTGEASEIIISAYPSIANNEDQLKIYGIGLYLISEDGSFSSELKPVKGVRSFQTIENFYTKIFEDNDEILGKDTDTFYKKVWRNGKWNEVKFS